jgi:hypothetical protein
MRSTMNFAAPTEAIEPRFRRSEPKASGQDP